MPISNTSNTNQNSDVQSDLPPMPPTFQTTPQAGSGGSGDNNFFSPTAEKPPQKTFGGNRLVATILGVLLLVVGVGAGTLLVLQPQLFNQKAALPYVPSACANCPANECHCLGGDACTGYVCDANLPGQCVSWGRSWCRNMHNQDGSGGMTCCEVGYICNPTGAGCVPGAGVTPTPRPSTTPTPGSHTTPTPTPILTPTPTLPGGSIPPTTPVPTPTLTLPPTTPPTTPPTFTPRPSPTPSPTPVYMCNSSCTSASQCPSNLSCTGGFCRNPSCVTQPNCLCPSPTPTTSPTPGPTAVCSGLKAYTTSWVELTAAQLSALKSGNSVEFCVFGTTTGNIFDMARFTINGTVQTQTTTKRPGTNDYCQLYTIPAGVYTFNVTAQIHHAILGWIGP